MPSASLKKGDVSQAVRGSRQQDRRGGLPGRHSLASGGFRRSGKQSSRCADAGQAEPPGRPEGHPTGRQGARQWRRSGGRREIHGTGSEEPPAVDRDGAIEGLGSAGMLPDAFNKPVGSIIGPNALIADAKVVCKVVEKIPADPAGLAAQRVAIRDQTEGPKGSVAQCPV